jgi:hypothetical protein
VYAFAVFVSFPAAGVNWRSVNKKPEGLWIAGGLWVD